MKKDNSDKMVNVPPLKIEKVVGKQKTLKNNNK